MSVKKVNEIAIELLIVVASLLILILASANIERFVAPKTVLGVKTENKQDSFWIDFLSDNPSYIPGWIELGRLDKVREIDPNYF